MSQGLDLFTTDELVEEIKRRHDFLVMAYGRFITYNSGDYNIKKISLGHNFSCLAAIELLKDHCLTESKKHEKKDS